jgi:phage N-6-adenine-methyltransferase
MSHEKIGGSDEWYTPKYIFEALGCIFDMDVAAPANREFCNVPAKEFITEDSINSDWKGFVWVNPPYSKDSKRLFINKLSKHTEGGGIALLPDRTSASWWQIAARESDAIMILSKRVKFINRLGVEGGQPSNGTTLFAYGEKAVQALIKAEKNKLGMILKINNV